MDGKTLLERAEQLSMACRALGNAEAAYKDQQLLDQMAKKLELVNAKVNKVLGFLRLAHIQGFYGGLERGGEVARALATIRGALARFRADPSSAREGYLGEVANQGEELCARLEVLAESVWKERCETV